MTPPTTTAAHDDPQRPRVAFVHLVPTPYFFHMHRRIDRELSEVELHSLYTHDVADQPWDLAAHTDIRPECFGHGERGEARPMIAGARAEWARAGRIIRRLRELDARFVVLYGYNDSGRLRILRWCRRHSIPCTVSSDSNIKLDTSTGLKRLAKRVLVGFAIRSAWGVMPFGTAGANYFLRYGARTDRVFRVPAEPDYSVIESVTDEDIRDACARHDLTPGRRRLVFCGRLIPLKRVDTLLDAFAMVATERPDWDLVVIGDGPLREELGARVPAGLRSRVKWTGFLSGSRDIASVYRACDALVLPSDFDQWALVVNEAVAAGLAVITSDVVGASEDLLRAGVNGRTFPPRDTARLAEAILDVTDPANIDRYKDASRRLIAAWRRDADPIQGLRAALRAANVIA